MKIMASDMPMNKELHEKTLQNGVQYHVAVEKGRDIKEATRRLTK